MACLFDTKVENVQPGNRMLIEGKGEWCLKLEPKEGCPYNAVGEESGQLHVVPDGTDVISGYGWGMR